MINSKKKIVYTLLAICILQLFLSLFWANKKSYLFMDELFSYVTSNRVEGIETEFPANEWLDESWLTDYMSVDEEHRFEYQIPYKNQAADVHPPLFYLFLHTASSLIPEEFSYWAGTGCNILFFIASTVALYFLGKELFENQKIGLLAAFLYSISYGGLNSMAFIRMYMLLTLITILHAYVYIKYFEHDEVDLKGYLALGLTVILGLLTQYYFVFVAFFFGLWYAVKFLLKKQYRKLGCYVATAAISAGGSVVLYPTMIKHIFGTTRGDEAIENLTSAEGYLEKLGKMWRLLDSQMFTNLFAVLLLGMVILLLIARFRGKKKVDGMLVNKAAAVLFASAGYFMVVTKVAPYQIDRYIMPVYPLVYLLVIGTMYYLMQVVVPKKAAILLCVLGFGGLSAVHMLHSNIPHTYSEDVVISPRLEVAEIYQENYAVYAGAREEDIPKYYDILQILSKYEGYYYIDSSKKVADCMEDMDYVKGETQIVLYLNHNFNKFGAEELADSLFGKESVENVDFLQSDEEWDVYLINKN